MSDLRSVYHHNGISDAIIDFFVRYKHSLACSSPLTCVFSSYLRIILPEWVDDMVSNTSIVSALVYESIKAKKKITHRSILGKVDRTLDLIGFPCRPR